MIEVPAGDLPGSAAIRIDHEDVAVTLGPVAAAITAVVEPGDDRRLGSPLGTLGLLGQGDGKAHLARHSHGERDLLPIRRPADAPRSLGQARNLRRLPRVHPHDVDLGSLWIAGGRVGDPLTIR
ncbi:MAG: hypothetical protein ACYTG5_14275 [Planctomycetota bacterium]